MAALVTTLSAATSSLTWIMVDSFQNRKITAVGFCSGCVAGLVAVTPAAGFISPWGSIVIGVLGGVICNLSTGLKKFLKVEDGLDVFALHGVGGFIGCILTGIFAQKWLGDLDKYMLSINFSVASPGGLIDGNPIQLAYQILAALSIASYSFFGSYAILTVIDKIPGLELRILHQDHGCDWVQMGENAYETVDKVSTPDGNMTASVL